MTKKTAIYRLLDSDGAPACEHNHWNVLRAGMCKDARQVVPVGIPPHESKDGGQTWQKDYWTS